jgi:uncharacterized protein YndB with AHSA1/START domain
MGRAPDRELFTFRLIDAPRDRVFAAFSDPAHLAQWWGPKDFTNTFHEFDFRPGGRWRFVMHGPHGDVANESTFVEVAPERVVFRHESAPEFDMTITLDDQDGKTKVGWRQVFGTTAQRDRVAAFAVEANEQNLDRLEMHVAGMEPVRT